MTGMKAAIQITVEYNISQSTVSQWINHYKEECAYTISTTPESNEIRMV